MFFKPVRGTKLDIEHPLSKNIVGLWLFNEGTGGKVFDYSGNEQHGTFNGLDETDWSAGKFGFGVGFVDGGEQSINCAQPSDVADNLQQGTIFVITKPVNRSANNDIVSKHDGSNTGWFFELVDTNGDFRFQLERATTDLRIETAGWNGVDADVWGDLVAVWDINGSNSDQKLYYGVAGSANLAEPSSYGHSQTAGSGSVTSDAAHPIVIGNRTDSAPSWGEYDGNIAYVAIFNKVLTLDQLKSLSLNPYQMLYSNKRIIPVTTTTTNKLAPRPNSTVIKPHKGATLNREHPMAKSLVACWLFNEGTGDKVYDYSGNGHIGTINQGSAATAPTWGTKVGDSGIILDGGGISDGNYIAISPSNLLTQSYSNGLTIYVKCAAKSEGISFSAFITQRNFDNTFGLGIDNGDRLLWRINSSGNYNVLPTGLTTVTDQVYTYVGVFKPSDEMKLFRDETLMGNNNTSIPSSLDVLSSDDVWIGTRAAGGTPTDPTDQYNAEGLYSTIMIWEKALTDEEVIEITRNPYEMFYPI